MSGARPLTAKFPVALPASIGAAALALCAIAGASNPDQFFRSYLMGYLFWVCVALGCLAILMIYHLVGGQWGYLIRRPLEAGTRTFPLLAVLFVPILFGMSRLFPWTRPEVLAAEPRVAAKRLYLSVPGFIGRAAACFAVWIVLSWLLNRWSDEQDRTGDPEAALRMMRLSAPGLLLYALTTYFVSVDWLMSLLPEWYSTIYGMLFMVTQALTAFAFMILVIRRLTRDTELGSQPAAAPPVVKDLGTLMFACVMLWAYMTFSQLIISWSGNLPDEIVWYLPRLRTNWELVSLAVLLFYFAVPFLLLLAKPIKRNIRLVSLVAAAILAMRVVDLVWLVEPIFHPKGIYVHWMDVAAPVGVGGLWVAGFFWQLSRRPLLALHDARVSRLAKLVTHG